MDLHKFKELFSTQGTGLFHPLATQATPNGDGNGMLFLRTFNVQVIEREEMKMNGLNNVIKIIVHNK